MSGAAEVTDLADEAEDTFLPVVAATHLADSPARGFSPGFSGTRGFSYGRGDHGRFGDRGFRGRNRDFRGRRFRHFDGNFFDFDFYGFGYPDYYQYNYPYSYPYPY